MTYLTQSSDFFCPSNLTLQFLQPWQLSGQFGNPNMQGEMYTFGVLFPGVFQPSQGPQCACVSQQLERAPESLFLESYPMSIAQFQQPGYVQSGSGNQRQDVSLVTDTFRGNTQHQTHERFYSGSDLVSAQAATRQQPVKIQMYLHNGIQSLDLYKLLWPT